MASTPPAVLAALSRFTAVELARLPARPITAKTFDEIYSAYMADLAARLNAEGIPYNVAGLATNSVNLVTDTYAITGRAFAYRVAQVEVARDDAIAAVLLPWSWGPYLDALGAGQSPPVARKEITPATATSAAVMEGDDAYRARIQLAPESLSTCGPEGAYLSFALGPADVLAAAVYGPMSFGGTRGSPFVPLGEVHIPVVSGIGDGAAPPAVVAAVQSAVTAESRRPIADFVTASAATIAAWTLSATLFVGPSVDAQMIGLTALARARAVADFQLRPGGSVLAQFLYSALTVPDSTGNPVVGFVDLGGFVDVNPGPVTPANPGPAYIAPSCTRGDGAVTVSAQEDGSTLIVSGGLSLRVVQVDE